MKNHYDGTPRRLLQDVQSMFLHILEKTAEWAVESLKSYGRTTLTSRANVSARKWDEYGFVHDAQTDKW